MHYPIADFPRLCASALMFTFLCSGCSKDSKPETPAAPRSEVAKADSTAARAAGTAKARKKGTDATGEMKAQKRVVAQEQKPESKQEKGEKGPILGKTPGDKTKEKATPPPVKSTPRNAPAKMPAGTAASQVTARPTATLKPLPPQPAEKSGPLRTEVQKIETVVEKPLDISALVVQKDLQKALSAKKGFIELPLAGQPPNPNYNHIRLVPRGAGPVLGLTIQVWRDHTIASARRKYSGFLKSYPGAAENRSVTNRTFFARYGDNLYLGYFALRERTNIVLTCNESVCDAETLHKAGLATKKRLPMFTKI